MLKTNRNSSPFHTRWNHFWIPSALCCVAALALSAPTALAAQPTIETPSATHIRTDSATLEAQVNPGEKTTTYHFEYGTSDCASSPCAQAPAKDGVIPKGKTAVPISQTIEGLAPGTTYHFRVFAKNPDATSGITSPDQTFRTYDLPPTFGPCPNDDLRLHNPAAASLDYSSANLPDCRVYEQVSPVDKNGVDALGTASIPRSSPNGDAVTFVTSTGIPGGVGSQDFPTYLSSFESGSWSTKGLLPPAPLGRIVQILGWTPDFSETLEIVAELDSADAALLARGRDGSIQTIVPHSEGLQTTSKTSYVAASADNEQIFFETRAALLPGAVADKPSVYEWDAKTGALTLASVLNDEDSPPSGAMAGAYDWIREGPTRTETGGSVAEQYLQEQHAVSDTGDLIFTTAVTGQLYQRRNPTAPQSSLGPNGECLDPAKACTVEIAKSHRNPEDPLGKRAAAFAGASASGNKVYFTSPEELTEDANTGPAVEPPSISRVDLDGTPSSVEPKFLPQHARGLATADGYLYWADPEDNTIGRAKLNGASQPTEVDDHFITGADNPQDVAVNSDHIYWVNAAEEAQGSGTIGRADINGALASVQQDFIAASFEGTYNPRAIAVDATHIYWGNVGNPLSGQPRESHGLIRATLEGSAVEEWGKLYNSEKDKEEGITTPQNWRVTDLTIYKNSIYLAEGAENITQNERLITQISATDPLAIGEFLHTKSQAGDVDVEASAFTIANGIAYWATSEAKIGSASIDNDEYTLSNRQEVAVGDAHGAFGLAADGEHLYWSNNQIVAPNPGNDLYRYENGGGGTLTDLTPDPSETNGAEVQGVLGTSDDGNWVYFAANGVLAQGATAGDCRTRREGTNNPGIDNFSPQRVPLTCNLYVSHDGTIEFIGPQSGNDAENWSPSAFGGMAGTHEHSSRVSTDGKTLIFRSEGRLLRYHFGASPELACLSCSSSRGGEAVDGEPAMITYLLPRDPAAFETRFASLDGRRVVFSTTSALVAQDTNGDAGCPRVGYFTGGGSQFWSCQDVYEWEAQGEGTCESAGWAGGCIYLLSSGKSPAPSFFLDASADGSNVFLITRDRLVGQDQDRLYDVYDARAEGGLASQSEPPPTTCEGDPCKGGASPPPAPETPGTAAFAGPGSQQSKGHKKKHKKHKHQKQQHKKHGGKKRAVR
jgi:hypothetical protein